MSNNILDEVEKNKGPRTCPVCGYQFPFGKFLRRCVMSFGLTKWSCQDCRELIEFDFIKMQMLWLLGMLVNGLLLGLAYYYFNLNSFNITFLIPFFVFIFLTFYFVKFKKHE